MTFKSPQKPLFSAKGHANPSSSSSGLSLSNKVHLSQKMVSETLSPQRPRQRYSENQSARQNLRPCRWGDTVPAKYKKTVSLRLTQKEYHILQQMAVEQNKTYQHLLHDMTEEFFKISQRREKLPSSEAPTERPVKRPPPLSGATSANFSGLAGLIKRRG